MATLLILYVTGPLAEAVPIVGQTSVGPDIDVGADGTVLVRVSTLAVLVEFRQAFFDTTDMAPVVNDVENCTFNEVSVDEPSIVAPAGTDQR